MDQFPSQDHGSDIARGQPMKEEPVLDRPGTEFYRRRKLIRLKVSMHGHG